MQNRRHPRGKRSARRLWKIRALYIAGLLVPAALLVALTAALLQGAPAGQAPDSLPEHTPSLTLAGEGQEAPWQLRLVNSTHPLPADWSPDLSVIDPVTGEKFDSRALEYLRAMLDAMEWEGLHPKVCSGYRSYESQVDIFQENVDTALSQGYTQEEAEKQAALWVMPPGCSEHQSGLAADIVSEDNQNLDETQEDTPEQEWLRAHCQEYGFILRYPKDKTELTGVNYESWHYRYVGEEAAREMTARNLCLEEYAALPGA